MREEFQGPWVAVGEEGFKVFQQLNRGYDFRVLLAFLARMDEQNMLRSSQADVAKDLGLTRQSVSATFRRLQEQGIVLKTSKNGVTLFQLKLGLARKVRLADEDDDEDDEYEDFLNEWQDAIDQHRASPNYKPLTSLPTKTKSTKAPRKPSLLK